MSQSGRNAPPEPRAEELIDSFQTSFDKSVKGGNDSPQAYNYKMRRLPATALILVKGTAKADEINRIALRRDIGITIEYPSRRIIQIGVSIQ